MKKFILPFIIFFGFMFLLPNITHADFVEDNWPYYKNIANGAIFDDENVELALDDQLITQMQDLFRDVRVIDKELNEIPYEIKGEVTRNKTLISEVADVLIDGESINKDELNLSKLKDDNKKSYTAISAKDLGREVSFVFDLGVETTIDRVVLFNYDPNASWQAIEVEASDDLENYKVIRSRIEDAHETWRWYGFPRDTTYRYYKVTLECKAGLEMNEIMLLSRNNATLNFVSNEGLSYKLYYGNNMAAIPEYPEVTYIEDKEMTKVDLSDQKKNSNFIQDSDKDNIYYSQDNCPYVANEDQNDADNDGIGDECQDNFVFTKPTTDSSKIVEDVKKTIEDKETEDVPVNQTKVNDRDADQISNLFDNCPDKYNPSQYDSDLDGKGNACDTDKGRERYAQILVGILIFVCLVIVFSIVKFSYSNLDDKK